MNKEEYKKKYNLLLGKRRREYCNREYLDLDLLRDIIKLNKEYFKEVEK